MSQNKTKQNAKKKQQQTNPIPHFPEIVELDLTQWPNSNANLSTMQKTSGGAGSGSGMISTSLADVNQSIISSSGTLGNAPTASPEFSGLTPMNTGSSGASATASATAAAAAAAAASMTTKREPYHRNWFLSSSASTPNPVSSTITNQYPANDSKSAQASPAASSLNAFSTTSDGSYQPTSNKRFQQQILDLSSQSHTSVSNSSSSPSSVPSTQIHQTTTNTNININTTSTSNKAINSNGESSHHKPQTINNNNKLTSTNEHKERGADLQQQANAHQQQAMPPPKQQQKSSRRTTSLLNLFMSNSQGKESNQIKKTIYRKTYTLYTHTLTSITPEYKSKVHDESRLRTFNLYERLLHTF